MNKLCKSAVIFGVLTVLGSVSVFASPRPEPHKNDRPSVTRPADPHKDHKPAKAPEAHKPAHPEQHRHPAPNHPEHHKRPAPAPKKQLRPIQRKHCPKHGWYEFRWNEDDRCQKCHAHHHHKHNTPGRLVIKIDL